MSTLSSPIRILEKVPDRVYFEAKNEIELLNWNLHTAQDTRAQNKAFVNSLSIHYRTHKKSLEADAPIWTGLQHIECVDTLIASQLPATTRLIHWVHDQVEGAKLGRVMLVKMLPRTHIPLHIDPGEYFKYYFRFHVPILTNENVYFQNGESNLKEHMPAGFTSQLLNRLPHSVTNKSDFERVHLICDISTKNSKYQYDDLIFYEK